MRTYTYEKIEDTTHVTRSQEVLVASIAVSLKRIADALAGSSNNTGIEKAVLEITKGVSNR